NCQNVHEKPASRLARKQARAQASRDQTRAQLVFVFVSFDNERSDFFCSARYPPRQESLPFRLSGVRRAYLGLRESMLSMWPSPARARIIRRGNERATKPTSRCNIPRLELF